MKIRILILSIIAGVTLPLLSFGQYFKVLQDYDSTVDFGKNVALLPDSTLLIYGGGINNNSNTNQLEWIKVSSDGSQVLSRHSLGATAYGTDFSPQFPHALIPLSDGG